MTIEYPLSRRLESFAGLLAAQDLGCAVISQPQHFFYFTGVNPGPVPAFLIMNSQREVAVASRSLTGWETILYTSYDIQRGWSIHDNARAALEKALSGFTAPGKGIGVELSHLPAVYLPAVQGAGNRLQDIGDLLWSMRRIKDAAEITQIEANLAANDQVFAAVRGALRPGVSEYELWSLIYRVKCQAAGESLILEADLGVGERGSNPDAKPGPHLLQEGEAVFVDVYSASRGYYADTTRVFSVGRASTRQREIFGIIAEALGRGEQVLVPGVRACDVDAVVRGTIEKAGYGEYFPHHSGHAYGLFQQEKPYLIPAEKMLLEPGMIVTLEPGIYLPGWGGMRLEGSYLTEAAGVRRLDCFTSELVEV